MTRKNNTEWFIYKRGNIRPFPLFIVAKAIWRDNKKFIKSHFTKQIFFLEKGNIIWANTKKETFDVGEGAIKELIASHQFKKNFFKIWDEQLKTNRKFYDKYIFVDLKKFSNKKLLELFEQHCKLVYDYMGLTITLDGIDPAFEKLMLEELAKIYDNQRQLTDVYNLLTFPTVPTFIQQEVNERYKILGCLKKVGYKSCLNKISKFYKKYWWTPLGWGQYQAMSFDGLRRQLLAELKKINKYEKEITTLNNKRKENRKKIKKELREIGSKIISKYVDLFQDLIIYHDYRKEIQMKGMYFGMQFLAELARRFYLLLNDLYYCTEEEVLNILNNQKVDWQEIKRRRDALFYNGGPRTYKIYSGNKAKIVAKKYFDFENKNKIKTLRGLSASRGKIQGRVKVGNNPNSLLKKFKKGDILVTGMTTPDFFPVMRKAKAIITDEGGITCHAAIVSRELSKPCVIATQIATVVLKDGDLVEVDANKGIIRKI